MYVSLADQIKKLAFMVGDNYSGDSPYLNIPIYQQRIDTEPDTSEIQSGPPSMYDEPDESGRLKNKEDIRRQGPRPLPTDGLENHILPVVDTVHGEPKEDVQGNPPNDSTTPDGRNEDRDTIPMDPDVLNVNPFRD